MTDESEQKGFGGLLSLASEVEDEVLPKKPASPTTEPKPDKAAAASNDSANKQTAAPKPRPPSPPRTADQTPPPPPKGSSAVNWFWSIVGIGILVALFNAGQDDRRSSGSRSTYSPSSAPSTYTPSRSTPSLEFSKPPVGRSKVLSVAQIRWYLRENMRIETKRAYANMDWEVDAFNAMVSDYNHRCESLQYRRGTLERAKREVEGMRSQIVAEALGRSPAPSTSSVAVSLPSRSTGTQSSAPRISGGTPRASTSSQGVGRSALTYEVQSLLKQLGYRPGPVDGIYGGKTKLAIEAYQRNQGILSDGKVTEELRNRLKQAKNTGRNRGFADKPPKVTNLR